MQPEMPRHPFPFDPTYGWDERRLRTAPVPPPVHDFESFWRETRRRAHDRPTRSELRRVPGGGPGLERYEIEYDGYDGFRVGGWLTRPEGTRPERGAVVGHGYGGREAPDDRLPGPPAVAIFPCARGFHRSARPDLPADAAAHVLHGIEHRDTYIHRHCVADLFSAVDALLSIAPEVEGSIDYLGGSFGGGMGALALAWEPRFRRAFLGVPSFGNHPLRLTMECVGSGESVRREAARRPEILAVLPYFDGAVAASFCRVPTLVSCALFDPAVPPPGQFSVYNALAGEKRLFVRRTDHFAWEGSPDEDARLVAALESWFDGNG